MGAWRPGGDVPQASRHDRDRSSGGRGGATESGGGFVAGGGPPRSEEDATRGTRAVHTSVCPAGLYQTLNYGAFSTNDKPRTFRRCTVPRLTT